MSSRKNGADARTKKAAQLFVVCEGNPDPTGRLIIPDVMRLRGYSGDEVVNCTLQMQVHREVKKLKDNVSTSASAVLSAAGAMVTLSTTVTTTVLASILLEESNDGTLALSLPSPLKKMQYKSHQRQIDHQNGRKGKDAYALALSRVTMLVAFEAGQKRDAKQAYQKMTLAEKERNRPCLHRAHKGLQQGGFHRFHIVGS